MCRLYIRTPLKVRTSRTGRINTVYIVHTHSLEGKDPEDRANKTLPDGDIAVATPERSPIDSQCNQTCDMLSMSNNPPQHHQPESCDDCKARASVTCRGGEDVFSLTSQRRRQGRS